MRAAFRSVAALVAAAFLFMAMVPADANAGGGEVCGDGTTHVNEGCDDADTESGDGCSEFCDVEIGYPCNYTGSGVQGDPSCESGICDDTESTPMCEAPETCGNGQLDSTEGCDDGGIDPGDGCNAVCLIEDDETCNTNVDGLVGGASCDSGHCDETSGATCEPLDTCGNGLPEAGEGCDDGGTFAGDGCSATCYIENGSPCQEDPPAIVGDGSCDSGVCDETSGNCEEAFTCGNGTLETGEGCDDGSTTAEDGCDSSCLIEDGNPCNEDDNGFIGDGSCASGNCDESSGDCEALLTCGNGILESGEGCDDGNTAPDDGCDSECLVEEGYFCNQDEVGLFGDASCASGVCDEEAKVPTCVSEVAEGACCYSGTCSNETASACSGFFGIYRGDGTSCTDPGICINCGNACIDFGETCDDGDSQSEDGCSSTCQEEECYSCTTGQFGNDRAAVDCVGPSTCELDGSCSVCGNGEVEAGEECDTGEVVTPCCDDCEYATEGTPCPDSFFCDGVEQCDGAGSCFDVKGGEPDCDELDSQCTQGFCDPKADECVAIPANEGEPCGTNGDCIAGVGECEDGVCTGTATVLSPSCRWIIVGGTSNADNVRVRSGKGSTMDASQCGDRAKSAGITTADIIVTSSTNTDEGVRFYGPPEVDGDIATGGSLVKSNIYLDIPGTSTKTIGTNQIVLKEPAGEVNTTGAHPLVQVCEDDQDLLDDSRATLDTMGDPDMEEGEENRGLRIPVGGSHPIDVTGEGVAVIDMDALKVGHGGTLTLTGLATDVIMIRINGGRMKFGYHSRLVLEGGLLPENVLIYADGGSRCRLSPGVVGGGTVFCPDAGRLIVGVGVDWEGTFLGAENEVQVRLGAILTHVPFTGF